MTKCCHCGLICENCFKLAALTIKYLFDWPLCWWLFEESWWLKLKFEKDFWHLPRELLSLLSVLFCFFQILNMWERFHSSQRHIIWRNCILEVGMPASRKTLFSSGHGRQANSICGHCHHVALLQPESFISACLSSTKDSTATVEYEVKDKTEMSANLMKFHFLWF